MSTSISYKFEGDDGMQNMQVILKMFRYGFKSFGGIEVESVLDHSARPDGAAVPEVIEYRFAEGSSVEIRPSTAAPEIEVCITAAGDSEEDAACSEARIRKDIENIMYLNGRAGYCCE